MARPAHSKIEPFQKEGTSTHSKISKQHSTSTALCNGPQAIIWACPLTPLRFTDIQRLRLPKKGPFSKRACDCLSSGHFSHESWWLGSPQGEVHLETRFSLGAFPSGKNGPDIYNLIEAMKSFGDVHICPHLKLSDQLIPMRSESCSFLDMALLSRDPKEAKDPKERLYECPCDHDDYKTKVFEKLRCPVEGCETEVYFHCIPKDAEAPKDGDAPKDSEAPQPRRLPSIQIVIMRRLGDISKLRVNSVAFWRQFTYHKYHKDFEMDAELLAKHWDNGKIWVEQASKIEEEKEEQRQKRVIGSRGKKRAFDEGDMGSPSTSNQSKKRKLEMEKLEKEKLEHHPLLVRDPGTYRTLESWRFESELHGTATSDWKEPSPDWKDPSHTMYRRRTPSPGTSPTPSSRSSREIDEVSLTSRSSSSRDHTSPS